MRVLLQIGPMRRAAVPSQRASPAHRSTPSYCLSICMAWARRPGPRAISRVRVIFRKRCIISMPSKGSNARKSTPASTPGSSLVTFTMNEEGKIDIAVATTGKQRLIASCLASEGVASGVARRIPLCFNDDSAQPRCREIVDKRLPDQILRKLHRSHRQVWPAEALETALKGVHCDHLLPSDKRGLKQLSARSGVHRDNYGNGKNFSQPPGMPYG